jgi:hypothetical protein
MSETTVERPRRRTRAECEAELDTLLANITRLEAQMDRDHAEGERLRAETQALKEEHRAILTRLEEQLRQLARAA